MPNFISRRLRASGLILCLAGLVPGVASAQVSTRMPSAADLDAARGTLSSPEDIERAIEAQRHAIPHVPASPVPAASAPDLSRLADQYERQRRARNGNAEPGERSASGLMVFVSLGMPPESLRRIIVDAERTRSLLVLRGVQAGSLKASAARIRDLMGEHRVAWEIDPALFKRFDIQAVPTVVLIDPARPVLVACGTDQCQRPSFTKVVGDASLGHALAAVEQADPEFAALARRYAGQLQGRW